MKRFVLVVLFSLTAFADGESVDAAFPPPVEMVDAGVALAPLTPISLPPTAPVLDPEADPARVLTAIHDAVTSKEWGKLTFIIVTLLVYVLRKFLAPKAPVFATNGAAIVMAFFVTFSGMLTTTWGAGKTPSGMDILNAVLLAAAASGFWSWLSKVVFPLVEKLFSKPPPPPAPTVQP